MKKLFLMLAAIACVAFIGCSDDEDNKKNTNPTGMTFTDKGIMSYSSVCTYEVYFVSTTAATVSKLDTSSKEVEEKWNCTVEMDFPKFTIKNVNGKDWKCEFYTGNVNSGFMYGIYPFEKK